MDLAFRGTNRIIYLSPEISGGASGASDHAEDGLMDPDNVGDPDAVFEPPTLKRFREAEKWQE